MPRVSCSESGTGNEAGAMASRLPQEGSNPNQRALRIVRNTNMMLHQGLEPLEAVEKGSFSQSYLKCSETG
jgi:hypothetical protein